jgi:hypothetical protein
MYVWRQQLIAAEKKEKLHIQSDMKQIGLLLERCNSDPYHDFGDDERLLAADVAPCKSTSLVG